jgi:hypothetical protein
LDLVEVLLGVSLESLEDSDSLKEGLKRRSTSLPMMLGSLFRCFRGRGDMVRRESHEIRLSPHFPYLLKFCVSLKK